MSKTFRLYREIDKSLPDKRPYDTTYFRERKEALELLQPVQYDSHLKSLRTRIEPLRHHGHIARLRAEKSHKRNSEADRAKALEARMQENHMRAILQEYHDNSNAFNVMQKCIENHQPIPAKTVKNFFAKDSRKYEIKNLILKGELETVKELVATSTTSSTNSLNSPPKKALLPPLSTRSSPTPPARPMPCFQQPTLLVDNRRSFDRTKSKSKWSADERQKLNELYREVPLPHSTASAEIWQLYFEKIADRFCAFFPQRNKFDVQEKMRTMILKRQMKEGGEEAYWRDMQGKVAHQAK